MRLLALLFVLVPGVGLQAQTAPDLPEGTNLNWDPRYELVFEDNFDDNTVNLGKWRDEPPWGTVYVADTTTPCPPGAQKPSVSDNRDRCLYRTSRMPLPDYPPAFADDDGQLHLQATQGPVNCFCKPDWHRVGKDPEGTCKRKVATGYLSSRQCFKYGYFEMRAKIPPPSVQTDGLGAAWWLWHDNGSCGTRGKENTCWSEIDMFEMDHYPGMHPHIHYKDKTATGCGDHYVYSVPAQFSVRWPRLADANYHTYSMEWTPKTIRFLFDGYVYAERCRDVVQMNPRDMDPMYIVMSINVNFGSRCVGPQTVFPYDWVIDYVRVWQIPGLADNPRLAKWRHARCKCRKWRRHPYYDTLNRKPPSCNCR